LRITEARADKIFQECALIQSEATSVALRLEPIKVLSVIGQRTFLNKFQVPVLLRLIFTVKAAKFLGFVRWVVKCTKNSAIFVSLNIVS